MATQVDLSAFLIEEVIPVDVKIMQTQTDVFQPRPPSPDYVPKRTGLDVATQIYSGDLFDFDREVSSLDDGDSLGLPETTRSQAHIRRNTDSAPLPATDTQYALCVSRLLLLPSFLFLRLPTVLLPRLVLSLLFRLILSWMSSRARLSSRA